MATEATTRTVQPVVPPVMSEEASNPNEARARQLAKAALTEGRVDVVIGWRYGYDRSQVIPAFITDPDDTDLLVVNTLITQNLVVFLKRKMVDNPGAKIGIMVKGCDSRTLVALLQEGLVDRDNLYVIGLPCVGTIERRELERRFQPAEVVDLIVDKATNTATVTTRDGQTHQVPRDELIQAQCGACRQPNAVIYDELVGPEAEPRNTGEAIWPELEEFEALSPAEKDAKLEEVFSTCIRCFACIHACPVCWCWDQCVARSRKPELVAQRVSAKDNLMFQMIHMFHVAGRCPSCGNCDRACPVGIPLHLLHRKMNKELKDMLGFEAGMSLEEKPVFQTFNIDDALGEH